MPSWTWSNSTRPGSGRRCGGWEGGEMGELVGKSAEHLVYLFCTHSRTQFVQRVLAQALQAVGSLVLVQGAGRHLLTPYDLAVFIIVTMVDAIEEWCSWKDAVCWGFPRLEPQRQQAVHWAASLWPGPMRRRGRMLQQISALAQALQHPGL